MPPKNPYAERLKEFDSFVFNEKSSFSLQGHWGNFFKNRLGIEPQKIILEIGCSNAFFLSKIAKENSGLGFIGMDWKFKVLYKGAKNLERENVKNVALLRNRAQEVSSIFSENEIDEIWFFFPDPWAKKSQLKNRVFQEDMLLQFYKILKPGGKIYVKTDHPGYFQWMLSVLGVASPEIVDRYQSSSLEVIQSGVKSRNSKQVQLRVLEAPENLPVASKRAQEAFKLGKFSIDYWNDERPGTLFSNHKTLFEGLFTKDLLPIYYLELFKK